MKKILILLIGLVSLHAHAQTIEQMQKYMRFVPSNMKASDINPSDIPSEDILRQMGLSDKEISEAMDYKYQRGKYNPNFIDTSSTETSLIQSDLLYNSMSDSLFELNDSIIYPLAKIYGQDFFRNNSISFYTRAYDNQAPDNYLLGENDELTISIWGLAEHSEVVTVSESGYINSSIAGRIYVGSKNFKTVKSLVRNRMNSFFDLKKSQFDLKLNYSRVISVNIIGEVFNPGSYSIPATNTLFNALVAAGGPSQIGSVRNIYLMRDGKTIDSLDVYKYLFDPSTSQDLFMQNNDYIYVPVASNVIDLKGEVNRPYSYEVKSGDKLVDLIKYAGGFTKMAYKNGITVKRIFNNSIKTITVDEVGTDNLDINNGDVITVNSIQGIPTDLVYVNSSTGVSGEYQFTEGERVYDMLLKSNSLSDDLFLESAYLVRTSKDFSKDYIVLDIEQIVHDPTSQFNILINEYDELFFLSNRDYRDDFEVTISGAVRLPNTFSFGVGITLADILMMSGGLAQEALGAKIDISRIVDYNADKNQIKSKRTLVRSFNISNDGKLSNEAMNFTLEPFDQVAVRVNPNYQKVRTITLSGEVKFPGVYSLISKDETVAEVIKRAGGLKISADMGAVKMYRYTKVEESPDNMIDFFEDDEEIVNGFFSEGEFVQIIPLNEEKDKMNKLDKSFIDKYIPVHLELKKAMKYNNSKYNIVLNDMDSIHISAKQDLITITGALSNFEQTSISVPHLERRANYYINNYAGGFTKHNIKENTLVISPSGKVAKAKDFGLFILYPRVKMGSTIKITEDIKIKRQKPEPVDWTKVLESTVTKISALASLYILYLSRQQ
ncbi:SLBB domain-containing protein [Flavobacteriales bacterium]|nr:SLBB domain-containing protein [Flavobacteriales bacterium]